MREPWRIARSYLLDAYDGALPALAVLEEMAPAERVRIVDSMLRRGVNAIPTSSAGRLFDAVASLIGLRHSVSFEGQAAMMLEAAAADEGELKPYPFSVSGAAPADVDLRPMIVAVVEELRRGEGRARIAARFHATLAAAINEVCGRMRSATQLNRVCLSGGCFQNALLLAGSVRALKADGFEVFTHREVPANDGGISLGQAAIACEMLRRESES